MEEWDRLDNESRSAGFLGKGRYITAIIRRDLYGGALNKYEQNEVAIPGKTPAQHEAEKQRLIQIVQEQRGMIEDLRAQLKQ